MSFTIEQVALLTAPLSREHIKPKRANGPKGDYIEAWHAIMEANRIFGFDGWDREMVESRCVMERECTIGEPPRPGWRVGYVARVRITVHAGDRMIVREGSGYGSGIDSDVGAAHESALKECESDAMKRSLTTFGNPFGLALYDKEQANVEAPPAPPPPRPAAKLPPEIPRNPVAGPAITAPPSEPKQLRLSQVRDGLIAALDAADSADRVRAILTNHNQDLDALVGASVPTYNRIIGLAKAKVTEFGGVLDWDFAA